MLTLSGLALRRLRHQRGLAAALALGLAAAIALAATVPLLEAAAAEAGLRAALAGLGSRADITVEQFRVGGAEAFEGFTADAGGRVGRALGDHVATGAQYAYLDRVTTISLNGRPDLPDPDNPLPTAAYFRDLGGHVQVLQGALPPDRPSAGDLLISVAQEGAQTFDLKLGDRLCIGFGVSRFGRALPSACTRVAAIWKPRNPGEAYWGGAPPRFDLMLGRDDLFGFAKLSPEGAAVAGRFFRPRLETIDSSGAGALAAAVNRLRGYFQVQREGLFATSLDGAIDAYQERQRVGAFTIQLVAAGLLMVALYAVWFVALSFLDGQARELAVLRARGWPLTRIWRLLLLQLAALGVLALPAGLVAGAAVTAGLSLTLFRGAGPGLDGADLAGIAPVLLGTLAAIVLLLAGLAGLAARRDVLDLRRAASRPATTPWYRRRNLDLGLALLAVPLLLESRLRGSGSVRTVGAADDPLGVLFPALALALLALVSLRLLPLLSLLLLRPRRGLTAGLAAWQLGRRPAQHARVALLVTLAVALGAFSSVYAATERRNSLDRAAYQAGADVRATYDIGQQPPALAQVAAALPGAAATSLAFRAEGSPGAASTAATVLGVDPGSFAQTAWSRDGLNARPLGGLMAELARQDPDGLTLPGRPSRLSAWVYSAGASTRLVAVVGDATGRTCACDLGSLDFAGWKRLESTLAFPGGAPAFPLKLRSLRVQAPAPGRPAGEVAISDLAAGPTVVEAFDRPDGWWQQVRGPDQGGAADLAPSDAHPHDGRPTLTLALGSILGDLVLRPAESSAAVPALISQSTLDGLGVSLGQSFPIHIDSHGLLVKPVATIDLFPTLYPAQEQVLVLPVEPLLARLARDGSSTAWPDELWVRLRGPAGPATAALRAAGTVTDLQVRSDLQQAALADPLRRALDAVLATGFVAALALAVLGFGLHFLAAARGRLGEYAILQANGLSAAMVGASLAVEQGVILASSLVAGTGLGLILAYTVLPAVQLGGSAGDTVPPTVVTLDPLTGLLAVAAVVAGAVAVGWTVRRAGSGFDLVEELRQLA